MFITMGNNVKLTFYITPRKFLIYFRCNLVIEELYELPKEYNI